MRITVIPCRDCGHKTISKRLYAHHAILRELYKRRGAHGMCDSCYNVARFHGTLPDPSPRRRRYKPPRPCRDCGRQMLGKAARRRQRDPSRFVVASSRGMCTTCVSVAVAYGTYPDPAPRRSPGRRPLDVGTLLRLRRLEGLTPSGRLRR